MKRLARLQQPFLILTIAVAVLAPSIPITDTFSLRPEIILAGILFLWLLPMGGFKILRNPVFIWLGVLAGMIALSLAYAIMILGRAFILQDTFEVLKVGVYAVIFYAAFARPVDAEEFKKTFVWILWIFLASAATGIMQYFNLLRINDFLTPLYLPTQPDRLITGRRVIGTVGNPNHYGMLMLLGVCLALAAFLWVRSSHQRWLSAACLMVCTTSMLLATSRTVLAIAALPLLFISIQFIMRLRKDKSRLRTIGIIALGMSATIALLLLLMPTTWFDRMGELLRIFESESLSARFTNWRIHWELFLQSPIFGLGPAKGLVNLNVDNEWLLVLARYGFGGVGLVFMLGASMFAGSKKLVRQALSPEPRGFGISLQGFLLAAPIYMLTSAIYHHQQLMAILLLLVGLGQSVLRSQDIREQTRSEAVVPAA